MILGSAVETIVDDRIATNIPSSSPESASMICRCVIGAALSEATAPAGPAAAVPAPAPAVRSARAA
jgi:hypothetical protein